MGRAPGWAGQRWSHTRAPGLSATEEGGTHEDEREADRRPGIDGVLAQAHGVQIVPHHGGGNIGVIAHMHLVASWPHAPFMELLHDPPIGDYRNGFSIMSNHPVVEDGYMAVPQGPGLGVEIDRDLILDD